MYNQKIIFYILTLFVILGGGILDNKYFNLSNWLITLTLISPLLILKTKVHTATHYLNKEYNYEEIIDLLTNKANLNKKQIKKYVRKIDILNDIDEDGEDIIVDNFSKFTKETKSEKEVKLILKKIDVNYLRNNLKLLELDFDLNKILNIRNRILNDLKND